MARYTGPKTKIFRREGINIFDPNTSKFKAFVKKSYPPGIHGKSSFGKLSEFGKQLREKQKAKKIYGILEKQFKKYYQLATSMKDVTGDALLKLCERRLDNVIFRAGFARTRPQARQMSNHGFFMINQKNVNIPSILVKKGDLIEVREKTKSFKLFEEFDPKKNRPPRWLKVDGKTFSIEILDEPKREDLEKGIDSQFIVEYYSK